MSRSLKEWLLHLREQSGMSRFRVAKELGISTIELKLHETGKQRTRLKVIFGLLELYGVDDKLFREIMFLYCLETNQYEPTRMARDEYVQAFTRRRQT